MKSFLIVFVLSSAASGIKQGLPNEPDFFGGLSGSYEDSFEDFPIRVARSQQLPKFNFGITPIKFDPDQLGVPKLLQKRTPQALAERLAERAALAEKLNLKPLNLAGRLGLAQPALPAAVAEPVPQVYAEPAVGAYAPVETFVPAETYAPAAPFAPVEAYAPAEAFAPAEALEAYAPYGAYETPMVGMPEAIGTAVVWDQVELPGQPLAPVAPMVEAMPELGVSVPQLQPVFAERKAALNNFVQGKKAELSEKKAQLDLTLAQRKAMFQTEGGFDRNSILNKLPSLKKA